jgi:hypothetical protein
MVKYSHFFHMHPVKIWMFKPRKTAVLKNICLSILMYLKQCLQNTSSLLQGCQIFLDTKYGRKFTKLPLYYKIIPNDLNIFQTALNNLHNLRFWVWKYTIWQP